jgi:hypothetical protein
MRRAKDRGTPRDAARFSGWAKEFSGYRHAVDEGRLERWLKQFVPNEDLAARLLDCVDFISHDQIASAFRAALRGLDGWHRQKQRRRGKWRFVAFSSHSGESGDAMLHQFRVANGMATRHFNDLFISRSDLLREPLGEDDTVVFVDDFSATGDQATTAWSDLFRELLPGEPNCYLLLVMASETAVKRIKDETDMVAVPHFTLAARDYLFSDRCNQFEDAEKAKILSYCEIADRKKPKGHKDCGFLVVFSHRCPNNTVPILHAEHSKWHGLFRRSG